MTISRVASISAGDMGAQMAQRVRAVGFKLVVCDRAPAVPDAFAAKGVRIATSPADCAGADAVVVLLADDAQIIGTMTGEGGIAGAIPPRHRPILCMMITTLPGTLDASRAPLEAAGTRPIDPPVRRPHGRGTGNAVDPDAGRGGGIEPVMLLTQSLGSSPFHCGLSGTGKMVKAIGTDLQPRQPHVRGEPQRRPHVPATGGAAARPPSTDLAARAWMPS